ncbi:hypothetical protein LshimejAT787_0606380 [Lyophyllum shimeji]|uniref:BTB domain-containing protein n=1 Tax=Lyophyllum shimeji TaxID=47721 RepID=A0A9P3UQQ5_LYOSH|nr:hypothetical protein LshimejAT787_0606380 [Lyophyllum shimeji]
MSTPQESLLREITSKTKQPRRTSERFCAGDADVTFVSSDNVVFRAHRKNLDVAAAAFPPSEFDTHGEEVPLTEDSATLELLFQYIYPQRHPDLESTPFDTLAPLAEAAEKYEVFAAMNICKIRMKNFLPNHAIDIFNYASKHGYADILALAAPFLLDIPLEEILETLSVHLYKPWVCYRQAWSRAARKAIMSLSPLYRVEVTYQGKRKTCPKCDGVYQTTDPSNQLPPAQLWVDLGEKRSRAALEELFTNIDTRVWGLTFDKKSFSSKLDGELSTVPSFDTFL